MGDGELAEKVAKHEEAIDGLRRDVAEIKSDLREALKRWPPGLAAAVTVLSSCVTGLVVYLVTH